MCFSYLKDKLFGYGLKSSQHAFITVMQSIPKELKLNSDIIDILSHQNPI